MTLKLVRALQSLQISAQRKVVRKPRSLKMEFRKKKKLRKESTVLQPRFIYYLALGVFYISNFIGITTYIYERKARYQRQHQVQGLRMPRHELHHFHLRHSRALQWYSSALLLLITLSIPFVLQILYEEMHFLTLTRLLAFVGNLRYVLIQGLIIVLMFINCCRQHRLMRFLNSLLRFQRPLLEITGYLRMHSAEVARFHCLDLAACILICVKVVNAILPFMWTEYVVRKEHATQRPRLFASLIFNCCCMVILLMLVVIYCICALRVSHYGKQINTLLQYALAEVKEHLEELRPFKANGRNRMMSLSTVIRRLQRLHKRNTKLGRDLVGIYSPVLLAYVCYAIVMCTVQLFVFYFLTCSHKAGIFKTDGTITPKDKCSSPNFVGVLQVVTTFIDICIPIWGTYAMQASFSATNIIVAENSTDFPLPRSMCSSRCCEMKLEAVVRIYMYNQNVIGFVRNIRL